VQLVADPGPDRKFWNLRCQARSDVAPLAADLMTGKTGKMIMAERRRKSLIG